MVLGLSEPEVIPFLSSLQGIHFQKELPQFAAS